MKLRKLRIAWSVFWVLACVLLVVLWVRSYKNYSITYHGPAFGSDVFGVFSKHGVLDMGVDDIEDFQPWSVRRIENSDLGDIALQHLSMWGISRDGVRVPYWFAVVFSVVLAALPWLLCRPKQFSLRTLLFATTLVALVLGVAVWAGSR